MTELSRREFAALVAATAAPLAISPRAFARAITAQDVVDRIQKNIGSEWKRETVDGLKAGEAVTAVTGIVTTSLASLDVLQRAVKVGANMVVTAEPTFYSRGDARTPPAGRGRGGAAPNAAPVQPAAAAPPDPVFTGKNDFITKHNLVVFRLAEHWRQRQPDPLVQGLAKALGWTQYASTGDPRIHEIPATRLESIVGTVTKRLQSRGGLRVVGNPQMPVRRVGLLPGSTPIQASLALLPQVDVIVGGEVREWESVEYVRDKAFSGAQKALVLVGRIVSEDPGMSVCADWLKGLVTEIKVTHLSAGDPYWRPGE
jgi:putative NIF3 family GTP cyclohydrolase 1 type 2